MTDYLERLLEEQWERKEAQEEDQDWGTESLWVLAGAGPADSPPPPGPETAAAVDRAAGWRMGQAGQETAALEEARQLIRRAYPRQAPGRAETRRAGEVETPLTDGEAQSKDDDGKKVEKTAHLTDLQGEMSLMLDESSGKTPDRRREKTMYPDDFLSARLSWQQRQWSTAVRAEDPEELRRAGQDPGEPEEWRGNASFLPAAGQGTVRREKKEVSETRGEYEWSGLTAQWVDQGVRDSLAALPEREAVSKIITVERSAERLGGERLEAERLDRLFRRDARRYDGGYQLL